MSALEKLTEKHAAIHQLQRASSACASAADFLASKRREPLCPDKRDKPATGWDIEPKLAVVKRTDGYGSPVLIHAHAALASVLTENQHHLYRIAEIRLRADARALSAQAAMEQLQLDALLAHVESKLEASA